MNKAFLRGNVGADPKITTFDNGGIIAQFTLATTERGYKTRDGKEIPDLTIWHNIVVKRPGLAGVVKDHVRKGSALLVEGKIITREYTASSGEQKRITEIWVEEMELLGGKREGAPAPTDEVRPAGPDEYNPIGDGADDLPF